MNNDVDKQISSENQLKILLAIKKACEILEEI